VITLKSAPIALIATAIGAATTVLAATAHADPDSQQYPQFASPSGNIYCEMAISYKGIPNAECFIQQASYAGQLCQGPVVIHPQFEIAADGHPPQTCRGAAKSRCGRHGRHWATAKPGLSPRSAVTASPRV
jgi:hypothetical protein